MARKKQEIALQQELNNQEQWTSFIDRESLSVIDVYQEWCGSCVAMQGIFRRIKNEIGDDLLRFAVAKADTIETLERYRGKCEPCFLIYGSGHLVDVIRGANPPVIERAIKKHLANEHKILNGDADRVDFKDPLFAAFDASEEQKHSQESVEEEVEVEVTVALIKPDAVAAGKVDEIIENLKAAGIEVLEHVERQLTETEAREFYSHMESADFFESLVKFMASGPSNILVLSKGKEGVIKEFRDLLGPPSVEDAKELAPDSLRAKYGSQKFQNALHGADSKDSAIRELAFFFPEFVVPKTIVTTRKESAKKIQRTMALIRPDAFAEFKDAILEKIHDAGFNIAMQKEVQLSREQVESFYKEHHGADYFDSLIDRMTNGPLLALCLARKDAVQCWRDMLGPKEINKAKEVAPDSLRAVFSLDDVPINLLHGSDSEKQANEEIQFFFPVEQTVMAIKPDAYENKDEILNKIKEAGFHVAARKETHLTKEMAQTFYKDQADKEYYDDLVEHMTSGNTLFLVLSREDAVNGWRNCMGYKDPEIAATQDANSIRALFGKSVKENAVHGASNLEHAKASMSLIFGDLEFDNQGNVVGGEVENTEPVVDADDESKFLDREERVMFDAEQAKPDEDASNKDDGNVEQEEHGNAEHDEAERVDVEHGETEHGETEHGETVHGETEHGETEHGDAEHGETEQGAAEHGDAEHGAAEHGDREHGAAGHYDAGHGDARHDDVEHSAAEHGDSEHVAAEESEDKKENKVSEPETVEHDAETNNHGEIPQDHHEQPSSGHHEQPSNGHQEHPLNDHHEQPSSGHHERPSSRHQEHPSNDHHERPSNGHQEHPSNGQHERPSSGHHENHTNIESED